MVGPSEISQTCFSGHGPVFSLLERNSKAWGEFLDGKLSILFSYESRPDCAYKKHMSV